MTEPLDQSGDAEQPHPQPQRAEQASGTGHDRVDAALDELARITARPPAEQVSGFAMIHRELSETLTALDDGR